MGVQFNCVAEGNGMGFWAQLGLSLVVAIVTSYFTVKLAFQRFRDERWWERKASSYASIIDSLYVMKRSLEQEIETYTRPGRRDDEAREQASWEQFCSAKENLYKAIDTSEFLLSSSASEILQTFKKEFDQAEKNATYEGGVVDMIGMIGEQVVAVRKCLLSLPSVAKDDLGIGTHW